MSGSRILITGTGAVCGAGMGPGGDSRRGLRRALRARADHAVGHGRLAVPRRGGDPGLQPARAGRGPQAAQADPPHRPGRHLRRRQRARRGRRRHASRLARRIRGGDVQRPLRRVRRIGRRQLPEPVRLLSADDGGARRPRGVRPRAHQRRESDVAPAHAAQQRARPPRHQVHAEGSEHLHHQSQLRRRPDGDRGRRGAARRRGRSRGRGRPRHADRARDGALLLPARPPRVERAPAVRRAPHGQPVRRRRRARWCSRPRRRPRRAERPSWASTWAAATHARRRG